MNVWTLEEALLRIHNARKINYKIMIMNMTEREKVKHMSHLNSPRGIYQLEKILERLDSIDETLKEILKELKKEKIENKSHH
jgi:hypothetical protein